MSETSPQPPRDRMAANRLNIAPDPSVYASPYEAAPAAEPATRSLKDYFLLIRERIWWAVAVFLLISGTTAVYTLTRTPQYEGTATIRLLRDNPNPVPGKDVLEERISGGEDLNTQMLILSSAEIVKSVAERLRGKDLEDFAAPYKNTPTDEPNIAGIIASNRTPMPVKGSLVISITYRHPNSRIAALVANLFVEEYIASNQRNRVAEGMRQSQFLTQQVDQQRQKVEESERKIQRYKESHNLVSLDQRRDIATERLRTASSRVTETATQLNGLQVARDQVRQYQAEKKDLTELSFIASEGNIAGLVQQCSAQRILVSQLAQRYRAKYPKMIEANNTLAQLEQELQRAIASASSKVEASFETTKRSLDEARANLAELEAESLRIDSISVEYQTLLREAQANEQLYQMLLNQMKTVSIVSGSDSAIARPMDPAVPSFNPSYPKVKKNILAGLGGGLAVGLGLALLIGLLDDRVKSAYDVESVVGLPLLAVIPVADLPKGQTIVTAQNDSSLSEGFRTLYSSLKLQEIARRDKFILLTSTMPGEGKSFVSKNLATTFASHGERTLLIDCDLRRPSIHRQFGIDPGKGLLDYCQGNAKLDEATVFNAGGTERLDVIFAGGRSRSPTQMLSSDAFGALLKEVREKYDRVIFDTPPFHVVADARTILPHMDGSVFVMQFSRVKRKAAQMVARSLKESTTPCFGAVLNGINFSSAGHYYSHYYDKAYQDYYISEQGAPLAPSKPVSPPSAPPPASDKSA